MPYPYKNSDGKAIKGFDAEGKPKPKQLLNKPLSDALKEAEQHLMGVYGGDLITKEEAQKLFGTVKAEFPPVIEPVLIKATAKPHSFKYDPDAPIMADVIKRFYIDMRVSGLLLQDYTKFGVCLPIDASKDYTESEVERLLDQAFNMFKKEIINKMKGKP